MSSFRALLTRRSTAPKDLGESIGEERPDQLLDSSFQYVQSKRAFETAIAAARRKGWPDEEIARVTGVTVDLIEAVSGKRR